MAHQRTPSNAAIDSGKEPHSVSLKVLRLSRPSFVVQHPLPDLLPSSTLAQSISPAASQAYPHESPRASTDTFILSSLLTFPPAFGNAYVGETFACTLCANNELSADSDHSRKIGRVRIDAEMETPSLTVPLRVGLPFTIGTNEAEADFEKEPIVEQRLDEKDLAASQSLQGIVEYHLKEEGDHILAVTVSYTETGATSGRLRSFRKLYQFVARSCLVVRTKTGTIPEAALASTTKALEGKLPRRRWALEAQLENCGEEAIVLEAVGLETKPWCKATSLNWDIVVDGNIADVRNPLLAPKNVQQVCFLVEENDDATEKELDGSNRLVMGILSINWRGPIGNRGSLTTGWLGTRLR